MRPSVLVVEDDLATRNLLRVVLNRYEFDVDALGSSVDVMMLLSSVDYSALLFDLYLHGTSGYELIASLFESRPDILSRIVVVSSAPKQELDAIRQKHPMICVLRKPFELYELVDAVKRAAVDTSTRDLSAEFCRRSIVTGAKAGAVRTPSADGARLNVAMSFGYTTAMLDPYASVAIDEPYPVCTAYRRQRAVWFASVNLASAYMARHVLGRAGGCARHRLLVVHGAEHINGGTVLRIA